MFAFFLGCFYLLLSLIYLWLIKEKFNIFGFVYNPKNKKFLLILDFPFLLLCFAAIVEETHWFLYLLFFTHLINSCLLIIKPEFFYQSKDEMQLMYADYFNNLAVIFSSVAGVGCLLISYL
ncbi:MAG: hypothetical protein CMD68_04805 [Gammaproteobacteria bacterium]|nr:hypothetical protein [Gammaproteobacteria bacterium]|tara:strand:- start:702 stop:1064 length:363 start_codon:yes stop_codon:yes gene_type:complete